MRKLLLMFLFVVLFNPVLAVQVEFTEVMYQPEQTDNYNEWIEIYADSSVDLMNYSLCGKSLAAGYIDRNGSINNDEGLILSPGQYAIITDGGSGTEVYDNFNVDPSALSVSVDASSLCNVLSNSGKLISLEVNGQTLDSVEYSPEWGASGNGDSLQLMDGTWRGCSPTPASINACLDPPEEPPEESDPPLEDPPEEPDASPGDPPEPTEDETPEEPPEEVEEDLDPNWVPEDLQEESIVIYPKGESKQSVEGPTSFPEPLPDQVYSSIPIYSKGDGNIKTSLFLLLFISVILNIIFIVSR